MRFILQRKEALRNVRPCHRSQRMFPFSFYSSGRFPRLRGADPLLIFLCGFYVTPALQLDSAVKKKEVCDVCSAALI